LDRRAADLLLDERAHGAEQLLAGAKDASTEHDDLRLEEVRDRRDAAGERLAGLLPDLYGDRIPCACSRRDVRSRGARHARFLRPLRDRRTRRVRLEAAAPA